MATIIDKLDRVIDRGSNINKIQSERIKEILPNKDIKIKTGSFNKNTESGE